MSQKEKLQSTIPAPVITERKEVEPAPKENEEWFRLLVETSLDYIFQTDQQGRTIYCSPSIEHVLGYHPEEREGTQFSSILLPSELPKARALFKRVMKGEVVQNLGIEVFHKNGRTVPLEISVTPLVENKKVTGMFGIARDITERKQTEELYRTLTGSSPIGIYVVQEGKFVFTNPQFQEDTGYGGDELLGMDALNIVLPADRNMVRENAISMLKGERSGHYEYRVVSRDGDIRWVLETVASIQHQGKRATLGNYMDITERKQTQEKIQQQNEFLNNILDSITHPFYVVDASDYTVRMANPAAKMGDLSRNLACYVLTHKSDKPCEGAGHICPLKALQKTKKPVVVEHIHYDEDGNSRNVEVHGYPIFDAEGNVIQMIEYSLDITERKQAEEALRQAEEKYRTILEEMEDTYFEVDLDGNYTFVNDRHCRALGYSREETIGMNARAVTAEEDYQYMLNAFNQAYQTGEPIRNLSYRMVGKDGETGWTEVSAVPTRNQQGEIIGFRGIGHDISERKQAEEALRQAEERNRVLVETAGKAGEGIVILQDTDDQEGSIVFVNDECARMSGYSQQELLTKSLTDFLAPDTATRTEEMYTRRQNGDAVPSRYETLALRKDGTTLPVEAAIGVTNYQGKIATVAYIRDITERKRAEHDLKERIKELQCLYAIASIAERPGITPDELYQEAVRLLPAGWQYPEITCARIIVGDKKFQTWNYTETEWDQSSDIKVYGANVGAVEVNYLAERPEIDEGPFTKEQRLLIDAVALQLGRVTERKQMQQELMQKTSQLEKASQAKSEFLASMSHELRTPLNAVIGFSELMLDGIPGDINDEQRQCLSDVLNSGQHLLNLVNDVLDIAKVEARKVDLKLENLNLPDVINDVLQTVKPILAVDRHRMEVSIEDGLPQVRADEHRLRQIFFNLLGNAIKFTPPGGAISIEVSRADDWCHISVVDNGIGIKKEDRERVFEAFTQVDTLPGKEKGGTGLGLALARELVEMCGGRIWVESEYEKGSRFTFTLPLIVGGKPGLS